MIGRCLAHQVDGLSHYFNVFVLIEGGYSDNFNYPSLPGRYFYIASGGLKESDGADFNTKDCRLRAEGRDESGAHVMDGVGHDFPEAEQARVKSWLENTVVPAQLAAP